MKQGIIVRGGGWVGSGDCHRGRLLAAIQEVLADR